MHGSRVALAPARSVTSHARRMYHARYHGKYRFSRMVFGFDLFLIGMATVLFVADLFFITQLFFAKPTGLDVAFTAPSITSSEQILVSATVRASDGDAHQDVRLTWRLPDWVEIVRAEPPLAADRSIFFGRVTPGVEATSKIVVRVRAPKGMDVPFGVTVRQDGFLGFPQLASGSETRIVDANALVTKPFGSFQAYASGASLPILVENTGSSTIPIAVVHVADDSSVLIDGQSSIVLGALRPGERRILFSDPVTATSTTFAWKVLDGPQVIATDTETLQRNDTAQTLTIIEPLISDARSDMATVPYLSIDGGGQFFVFHPRLADGKLVDRVDVSKPGTGTLQIPVEPGVSSGIRWSVLPSARSGGSLVVYPMVYGTIRGTFPISTEARYTSKTGDQLGIGPTPPQANATTTYWIATTIGPGTASWKDVTLTTPLAPDVLATGNTASQVPATFRSESDHVTWTIPSLVLTGDEAQTFAFEVAITPKVSDVGQVLDLVATTTADAIDAQTGVSVIGTSAGDDTRLTHDLKAVSDGRVR